jgi:hypothetical protein
LPFLLDLLIISKSNNLICFTSTRKIKLILCDS